ncbi:LOW QUALITY PROTEIN: receptor-type tyrosine-protein phosphatase epsilon-like [Argopecten irradians]|uniref:LOW QUALITY PROTEIN: receptor-type tyrosine-protein phosphatase epsilon-like n=1 Tax=Argopecten irradians TaxID=31199 RepID=UPI003718B6DA
MCQYNCSNNCRDMVCAQDNGQCTACVPTKRGEICELDCPANCQNGICDKTTASCSGCVGGFFGTNCSMPCISNCSECDQNSGECTKCVAGLYGFSCNMTCGHCSSCVLDSGVCSTECDTGYGGEFCRTKQKEQMSDSPSLSVGRIVGFAVGVVLVAVLAVILVVISRRCCLNIRKEESYTDVIHADLNQKNIYSELEETEKNIYSTISEPSKDSENRYMNSKQESLGIPSSDPVGFPVSKLKSLVNTKLQNKAQTFMDEFKSIPTGALHPQEIGLLPQNRPKNRLKRPFTYDHSRVILEKVGNDRYSDYINANYIDSVTENSKYVAAQGPMTSTINDFWRMIWQLNTCKIVSLQSLIEQPMSAQYWPDEGEPFSTSHFNIVLDRERSYGFYVIRDLTVTDKKTKSARQIHQFHFITWPDHGTPDSNELVVFHRRVKNYVNILTGKMVVHCSSGTGRTGTFLALDALLEYGKAFGRIDIMHYVKVMRNNRVNMVQTVEQYIAVHQFLIEAFDMPDTLIPRDTYHVTLAVLADVGPAHKSKLNEEYKLTQSLKPHYDYKDYRAALLDSNKMKNRSLSVLAVDKFRVCLPSHANDRTDYINAVLVPSYASYIGYIVTQCPLEDTVVDLLTMIVDHKCQTLVIIQEDAINWLPKENEEKSVGSFTLEQQNKAAVTANVDLLDVLIENEHGFSAMVRVFHLSGWDVYSPVPPDSSSLLQLMKLVDSRRKSDDTKTTVVMCRDGFSQSGLFCCISNARDQMKADEEVDIFQISRQILVRCPSFLINFEQYQYCYNIIREYLDTTHT